MQIGNLKLTVPLLLAPMAGITDLPFRVICRELGCGMTVSEMVSAKGLLYKNIKTFDMLRIDPASVRQRSSYLVPCRTSWQKLR